MSGSSTTTTTPSVTLFFSPKGERGWMSNWSQHAISDGYTFPTAEHYLMFRKADLMGDPKTGERILQLKTPDTALQVKRLGRQVKPWNEELWVKKRLEIMVDCLRFKVQQNPVVREALLATGDSVLAEAAARDRIWGIGMGESNPEAGDPSKWRGLNLLGEAWMTVRNELNGKEVKEEEEENATKRQRVE